MLASAFCQYFAQLAYSSLYYGVVCQRSSGKSTQKAKLTKWQKWCGPERQKMRDAGGAIGKTQNSRKRQKRKKSARNV